MTKHDLKELAAMGAELGAAKAENEMLRRLLEGVRKLTKSQRMDDMVWLLHKGRIESALSQQADPAEPAPEDGLPQSGITIEKDVFGTVHIKLGDFDYIQIQYQYPYTDNASQNVLAKRIAELLARPAQTEQQPVSWQFYQDGKWWNGGDRIKDHRKNTEAAGIPVRDLYAAPIAQTAPQPEQSGLVTEAMRNAAIAEYDRHDGEFSVFAGSVIRAALSAQGAVDD